ncbi:MAG: hypothetical protein Q7S59_05825 [Sulfurimonas sp.]|jgi:cytochrome c553|nr:hypothetical protein [Sulfurimonas sp.]
MLFKGSQFKSQSLLYAVGLLLFTFLSGCNDKHKEQTEKNESSSVAKTIATPKIEVVINDNSHETKVKEKEVDANQSKSYYYDYNTKSASNENTDAPAIQRTAVDANLHVRSPYEEVQISMIVNNLSKKFILKCSACHNDYANGIIGPSLLGRDADYIFKKIAQFKSGEKTNVLMRDLINRMSDEEIKELANEIYQFNIAIKDMRK